jgi:hypothetical protein
LKTKLRGQCPCGYIFDALSNEKDAIVRVQLHFERFHKNFLPFGITNAEALALLKKGRVHRKQKVTLSNFSHLKQNPPVAQEIP